MPRIITAVEKQATLGEIADAMRRVFGEFQDSSECVTDSGSPLTVRWKRSPYTRLRPDSRVLLDVRELSVAFGDRTVVDRVSFRIAAGETLGVVGESGSGKSVTAFSILRLVQPPGRITGGQIVFEGRDLLTLTEREMRDVRGAGFR